MAAGIATLSELKQSPPYEKLDRLSQRLCAGLSAAAKEAGVPHTINRVGSMWTLFFTDEPVTDLDSAKKSDTARFGKFFWAMLDLGVYLPCSQFEAAFTSAAHAEKDIDQTVAAAREAFRVIRP